ncbi:MAG: hypothetical protein LBV75_09960 [Paludibacter sp.]|jgi:hypothetical protein|nr:hypothetical protein [Paludibacter sp.]
MKKLILFVFVAIISIFNCINAQDIEYSKVELEVKMDSILQEAHLLFKYEQAAWKTGDYVMSNKTLKKNYGGYLTYEDEKGLKTIVLSKDRKECAAVFFYSDNLPEFSIRDKREFSGKEKNLIKIYDNIVSQLSSSEYELDVPNGYNLNLDLIPCEDGYKMYVLTGTSQSKVIPFGNDYLFFADDNGEITSWQKFHSRLISLPTQMEGKKVRSQTHSHLRTTPLITATEIATFMLYAPLYKINEFSVYSPAIGKHIKYDLKSDKIIVSNK